MTDEREISPDVSIEELVEAHPELVGFLAERGVVCIRCGEPYWGTLRELMEMKGMAAQVAQVVADLNRYLAEGDN
jgi:hypothetical protein